MKPAFVGSRPCPPKQSADSPRPEHHAKWGFASASDWLCLYLLTVQDLPVHRSIAIGSPQTSPLHTKVARRYPQDRVSRSDGISPPLQSGTVQASSLYKTYRCSDIPINPPSDLASPPPSLSNPPSTPDPRSALPDLQTQHPVRASPDHPPQKKKALPDPKHGHPTA